MGLRARVIVTLVALVLPLTAAFTYRRIAAERHSQMERFAERFAERIRPHAIRKCERRPRKFSVGKKRVQVFAYNAEFQSENGEAPAFPDDLRVVGDDPVSTTMWRGRWPGATAFRVADSGACSVFVAYWKSPKDRIPLPVGTIIIQSVLFFLVLTIVGLIISVPLVRRIRKLTAAVSSATEDGFDVERFSGSDELATLAHAFDTTLRDLSQRDASLKAYIANTTHDLAIPLTVLQHRLVRLQALDLQEDASSLVSTALEESHYIAALIANMSAAARLDAEPKFVETDLCELVERVVTRHKPIAEQKGIELNYAVPDALRVVVDTTLVEQAVSNVVQNAIQYNVAGGHVAVVLEGASGRFTLSVADDGPGVSEEMLGRLTERAVRDDGVRNRNPSGQGFGLSITQRVCELHEWELLFENHAPGLKVTLIGGNGSN